MYKRFSLSTLAVIVLNATLLSALISCSVNPVTGKQELAWVDENWERKIGEQHYSHQQQAGGGPYTIDPDLTLYVRSVGKKLAQYSKRSHFLMTLSCLMIQALMHGRYPVEKLL